MNKTVLFFLILLGSNNLIGQTSELILRTKMSNASSANSIVNTNDGSLIYQPGKLSLFSYDLDKWIQLRQELRLCSDQLSILNGNSVELTGLLPERKGETLSWSGTKWKSDDFAFIYEGRPLNYSLSRASSIEKTTLNNIDRLIYMVYDGMYLYTSSRDSQNSGSVDFEEGGVSVLNISDFNNIEFVSAVEAQDYNTVLYNPNEYPPSSWFTLLGGLCKIGNYLYVAGRNGPSIIDISTLNNPTFVRSKEVNVQGSYIVTDNQFVYYISDNKVRIYKPIGDDLLLLGSADSNYGAIRDAVVKNGHLFFISGSGLVVYDISNTSNPSFVSLFTYTNPTSIAIKGDRAYVGSFTSNVISVIDISNPANLTVNHTLTGVPLTSNASTFDFEILENILYGLSVDNHVVFYDISDPNQTVRLDYVDLEDENHIGPDDWVWKLNLLNNEKVCISMQNEKIICFNIHFDKIYTGLGIATHPSNPTLDLENPLEVNGSASKIGSANWSTFSDLRVKKEVKPYKEGLDIIRKINPYQFSYRSNSGYSDTTSVYTGVMAQEMQTVMPASVTANDDSKGSSGLKDKLQYDSSYILWNLVNAIKELKSQELEIEQLIEEEKSYKK